MRCSLEKNRPTHYTDSHKFIMYIEQKLIYYSLGALTMYMQQ